MPSIINVLVSKNIWWANGLIAGNEWDVFINPLISLSWWILQCNELKLLIHAQYDKRVSQQKISHEPMG